MYSLYGKLHGREGRVRGGLTLYSMHEGGGGGINYGIGYKTKTKTIVIRFHIVKL
jgi:hypothetical protein